MARHKAVIVLLILGCSNIAIPVTAHAQVLVQVLSGTKTAAPGDFVTHVFAVENQGSDDVFDLEVTPSPGLVLLTPPGPLSLAHGAQETVFITVQVTAEARAGENRVTLTARSRTDPSIFGAATALIIVLPRIAVAVIPPPTAQADPGTEVKLRFTVENRGNVPDRFKLEATSRAGFPTAVSPEELGLLPGERGTAIVKVQIPAEATPGRDLITLKATSMTDPEVAAEASVTLVILPPPPEAITAPLYPLLPAQLKLGLRGSPLSGDYALPVWLSASGLITQAELLSLDSSIADLLAPTAPSWGVGYGKPEEWYELKVEQALWAFTHRRKPTPATEAGLSLKRYREPRRSLLELRWEQALEVLSWRLGLEVSSEEARVDSALGAEMGLELEELALKLRLDLLGPTLGDRAGLGLYSAVMPANFLSALLFLGYHVNNVAREPTISTVSTLEALADITLDLSPGLPRLHLHGTSTEQVSGGTNPAVDRTDWEWRFSLDQPIGPSALHLRATIGRELDRIAGTQYENRDFTEELSLALEELTLILRLKQSQRYDLLTDTLVESAYGLELEGDFLRPRMSLLLHGALEDGTPGFGLKLKGLSRTLDLALAAEAALAPAPALSLALSMTTRFDLPLPLIKTKGRVEGYVFIDENGDGRRDPGEPGVSGVVLRIDKALIRTDGAGTGFYRSPPLWPGGYTLEVITLPAGLVPRLTMPVEFEVQAGEVLQLNIPVARAATIQGHVFHDKDRDGQRDPDEPGLPGVHLLILHGPEGSERDTYTDGEGAYAFVDLLPGRYTVALDTASLPERFEPTTPAEVEVELHSQEVVTVDFGAAEKKRKIIVTAGIPVAEFTWTPEEPHAGETVTFDASASADPDGEIVKYEWDFNSDGEVDATGMVVSRVFATPGDYPVTLTVTDNDGNTASVTKVVTVLP